MGMSENKRSNSNAATRSSRAAGARRKPGSDLGRPAIDWEEAFAFYAALPPDRRSYKSVAERFSVSPRTVERHGRVEGWAARVAAIQADASARLDSGLGRAWAERIADIDDLVEASFLTYGRQLREGSVRITASEFVGLAKLLLLLHGEPAERVEVRVDAPIIRVQPSPERMLEVVRALSESGALAALEEALEGDVLEPEADVEAGS